jgi:hypothetical protein
MACALGADPATSAMQYLYGAKNVFAVERAAAHARHHSICFWIERAFVGHLKSLSSRMRHLQPMEHSLAMEFICETLMVRIHLFSMFAVTSTCLT